MMNTAKILLLALVISCSGCKWWKSKSNSSPADTAPVEESIPVSGTDDLDDQNYEDEETVNDDDEAVPEDLSSETAPPEEDTEEENTDEGDEDTY